MRPCGAGRFGGARGLSSLLCLLGLALAGCAGRRVAEGPVDSRDSLALYKARVDQGARTGRRFRMLVFGATPDRLHVEIFPPIGGAELIVDAGPGRLAVTLVDERRAYVGRPSAAAVERMLGLPLELETLLRVLLQGGTLPEPWRVAREPALGAGFPARLEIGHGERRLELELKRVQPLRVDASTLGTGRPPPGMEVRPLDELPPLLAEADGGP